jgi:FtsH-binding integral membrane protein
MNSRRMALLLIRTTAFFVIALVVAVLNDWPWFGVVAVALTGAACVMQLAGVLWLRRSERTRSNTQASEDFDLASRL